MEQRDARRRTLIALGESESARWRRTIFPVGWTIPRHEHEHLKTSASADPVGSDAALQRKKAQKDEMLLRPEQFPRRGIT